MPMDIIESALKNTTRLANNHFKLPLRRHFKSRFPHLNRNRLHERYSTETMFSSIPSLGNKYTCAQIFYGRQSHFSKVIGTIKETSGCMALESFIVEVGVPFHIMNDDAKMETITAWKAIVRKHDIVLC